MDVSGLAESLGLSQGKYLLALPTYTVAYTCTRKEGHASARYPVLIHRDSQNVATRLLFWHHASQYARYSQALTSYSYHGRSRVLSLLFSPSRRPKSRETLEFFLLIYQCSSRSWARNVEISTLEWIHTYHTHTSTSTYTSPYFVIYPFKTRERENK